MTEEYLQTVASLGYEHLAREPALLFLEEERLTDEMHKLAINHYNVVLASSNTIKTINQQMHTSASHLHHIKENIDTLSHFLQTFENATKQFSTQKEVLKNIELCLPSIVELLEIPKLIDTCLRNNWHAEVATLLTASEKILKDLNEASPQCDFLQHIQAQIEEKKDLFQETLFSELQQNFQISSCEIILNHLKSLKTLDLEDIKKEFLHRRKLYFVKALNSTDKSTPLKHLRAQMDILRTEIYQTGLHYRTLFGVLDSRFSAWLLPFITLIVHSLKQLLSFPSSSTSFTESPLAWKTLILSPFSAKAFVHPSSEKHASSLSPPFTASEVAALYKQTYFVETTVKSLNAAFFNSVSPYFENYMEVYLRTCLERCLLEFQAECLRYERSLSSETFTSAFLPPSSPHPLSTSSSFGNLKKLDEEIQFLHLSLSTHRPLSSFVQGIVNVFNELRQCAFVNMKERLCKIFEEHLSTAIRILQITETHLLGKDYIHSMDKEKQTPVISELMEFREVCKAFMEYLLPMISLSFQSIFGASHGFSQVKLEEEMKSYRLYKP